jgi:hypothetical protein
VVPEKESVRYRNTLILMTLSLALAGFYFLYLMPRMEERKQVADFEKQFFKVDPKEIEFIRIETADGLVDVVKAGTDWRIERPGPYLPDMQAVQKMLESLSQGRLIKVVGAAEEQSSFGLDKPNIIVSLGFSGRTDMMEIAGKSPSASGYYAFNRRFGKVFLVNEEFVRDFNLNLYDLRDKQLFRADPAAVAGIRIKRPNQAIDLEKTGDAWTVKAPFSGRASLEDVERLMQALSVQRAAGFVDWSPALSKIPQHISLELYDAHQKLLDSAMIYNWGTGGDQGALVHKAGAREAARTSRDFFSLLNTEASVYNYRNLFETASGSILKITATEGSKTQVFENKAGWKKDGAVVPEERIVSLLEVLRRMKAVKILREDRVLGKPTLTIELLTASGSSRLEVTNFNMDHEISEAMALFVPVKPGAPAGRKKIDYWYARSQNLRTGVVVSSLDVQAIIDHLADINRE